MRMDDGENHHGDRLRRATDQNDSIALNLSVRYKYILPGA